MLRKFLNSIVILVFDMECQRNSKIPESQCWRIRYVDAATLFWATVEIPQAQPVFSGLRCLHFTAKTGMTGTERFSNQTFA